MSELYLLSPWYNTKEWNDVYKNIFDPSSTLATKQNALDRLLIWKARCPSLPSGVEATMSLLNVHIQDRYNEFAECSHPGQHEICTDHMLRLAYTSALLRFVNHMFDKETAKGLSLFQAAKTFGVPEWIIELRHDAAHSNKLPHLELLREASSISFDWLQRNYWENHKLSICDFIVGKVDNKTELQRRITTLMNLCVSLSICSHPKCKIKNLADITDTNLRECLVNDAKEMLEDSLDFSNLKTVSINSLKHLMNCQAKNILNKELCSSYVNKVLLSDDSAFMSLELLYDLDLYSFSSDKDLNKVFVQCFAGLLSFLQTHDLLKDLLLELIKMTQNDKENNGRKCKLAAKWVSVILKAFRKKQQFIEMMQEFGIDIKSKDNKELNNLYHQWNLHEELNSLYCRWNLNDADMTLLSDNMHKSVPKEFTNINFIQPIISTYNPYLVFFIEDLLTLTRPQLPEIVKDKICQLARVIASPEKFPVTSSKIYTAEDLVIVNGMESLNESKQDVDVEIVEVQTGDKMEGNIECVDECRQKFGVWKVAPKNVGWATCPIGKLPWTQGTSEAMETQQID